MKLEPLSQLERFRRLEMRVKRPYLMRIQVVLYHFDSLRSRKLLGNELHELLVLQRPALLVHLHPALTRTRLERHEDRATAFLLVLVILALRLPCFHWNQREHITD